MHKMCLEFLNYPVKVSETSQSLTETELPLNIAVPLPMAFAAERTGSTFQFKMKQTKVPKISSWHA